jgi:predicted nucleic acid-binding protein
VSGQAFFDSNVVIYLTSGDALKAKRSRDLLEAGGGVLSVQTLNETVAVLRRKHKLDWVDIDGVLSAVRSVNYVVPLTEQTHDLARQYAERFQLRIYDANILAAAKLAGCARVWSEDMQDGLVVDGVEVRNPFVP